jgi:hypothetical protein
LFDSDVDDESEIVSTLALALRAGTLWDIHDLQQREVAARELAGRYASFDLANVVGGVPVVRMKPAIAEVIRYPGSKLAQRVRIRILSKFADAENMAKLYREILERERLPVVNASPGSVSWEYAKAHLVVDVGPREEIELTRLDQFTEYPQVYRFSFPLPFVVGAVLRGLLGHGQKKNQVFAAVMADHGRPTSMMPKNLIPACVLWYIRGERGERATVSRDSEAADVLNQQLLEPLGKPRITTSRDDGIWRDAQKISDRFDLARYFLQKNLDG